MNATKAQTWKLFTLTKKDYRDGSLTYEEASRMIQDIEATLRFNKQLMVDTWKEAMEAGQKALEACKPAPMVVEARSNPLNDDSPPIKQYFVPDGVCGFAWVWLPYKGTNIKFINTVKKIDPGLSKDNYRGGYQYWVWQGNQSMQKKETFARAMAAVLTNNGYVAYPGSRMD